MSNTEAIPVTAAGGILVQPVPAGKTGGPEPRPQPRIHVVGPDKLARAVANLGNRESIQPHVPSGMKITKPPSGPAAAALHGLTILSAADMMSFPYSAMGRMEAAPPGSANYQHAGTGVLVGPRMVLSATHLLKERPISSWTYRFVPAYCDGLQPKAPDNSAVVWSALTGLVIMGDRKGEVSHGGFDIVNGWDFAIFELSQRLGDIWGHLGIIWDDDAGFYESRQWTSVGYPLSNGGGQKPNVFYSLEISGVDKDDYGSRELESEQFVDGWGPFPNDPTKWQGWSGGPLFRYENGGWYVAGAMSGWDLDGPLDFDGVTVFAGGPRLAAVFDEAWAAIVPLTNSNPFGYVSDGNIQHVVYRSTDNHIYELFVRSDSWVYKRLTEAPNAVGAPAGYVTPGNVQHVVYRGNDNHIYELFTLHDQWVVNRLTQAAGAPGAAGDPFGYLSDGPVQHVVYRAADQHIYELFARPDGWVFNRLTGSANALSNPHAYVTAGNVQHVVYLGTDHHIYELFTLNDQWVFNRITEATGAPLAASEPCGYVTTGNVQHVVYRGTDNHIYELFARSDGWVFNRLTTSGIASGNPRAYVTGGGTIQHVIFRGGDDHVYELFTNTQGWNLNRLTEAAGAPLAASDPHGYVTAGDIQHVIYRGKDQQVNELFTTPDEWVLNVLTYHL